MTLLGRMRTLQLPIQLVAKAIRPAETLQPKSEILNV